MQALHGGLAAGDQVLLGAHGLARAGQLGGQAVDQRAHLVVPPRVRALERRQVAPHARLVLHQRRYEPARAAPRFGCMLLQQYLMPAGQVYLVVVTAARPSMQASSLLFVEHELVRCMASMIRLPQVL